MLARYFIIAFRVIAKRRLFSFVNTLGLAIGITICLVVVGYIRFEKSFDRFHPNYERIYRIRYERYSDNGESVRFVSCAPPVGLRIREMFPDVEHVARIGKFPATVSFGEQRFLEERLFYAEQEFFSIFSFRFIEGDSKTGIGSPNTAFISKSTAKKYFGDENPVGKSIRIDNKMECLVTGVFDDLPQNSHIQMDIVLPWANLLQLVGNDYDEAWGHSGAYTYVLFQKDADIEQFKEKLSQIADKEFGEILKKYKLSMTLPIQPLSDIHLKSHYQQEFEVNGDLQSIDILTLVALLIVIIAWINYINLSTAQSLTRAKEVGLRKVVGAKRFQLVSQFFVEVAILNFVALTLSILLVEFLQPYFQNVVGVNLGERIMEQSSSWLIIAGIFIAGVFIAGLYPVVLLSSFKPLVVLKGKLMNNPKGIWLRKALVVLQFGLAMVLLSGTLSVFQQISFMKRKGLGFSIDGLVAIRAPRVHPPNYHINVSTFKEETQKYPNILGMCVVTEVPGKQIYWDAGGIHPVGSDESKNYQIVGVDYDFVDLFDIQMVEGRNFSKKFPSDSLGLILNETAVKWMGFADSKSAIGKQVDYWGDIYTIVGVLKDYHQQSPKAAFEPHLYRFLPFGRGNRGMFVVKVSSGDNQLALHSLRTLYNDLFPNNPFEYFFINSYFDKQYRGDETLGRVLSVFSILAIIVTALGILGLFSFMVNQRTREISIRMVLGASTTKILSLFGREFIVLIIISFVVSAPLIYLTINQWLNSFANRMSITLSLFVIPFIIVISVAALTIIAQVIKAARANPIDNLRYE